MCRNIAYGHAATHPRVCACRKVKQMRCARCASCPGQASPLLCSVLSSGWCQARTTAVVLACGPALGSRHWDTPGILTGSRTTLVQVCKATWEGIQWQANQEPLQLWHEQCMAAALDNQGPAAMPLPGGCAEGSPHSVTTCRAFLFFIAGMAYQVVQLRIAT